MIRADAISGLILAAIGIYAAVTARGFGLGKLSEPGAGFFPFWAAVLMVICASVILLRAVVMLLDRSRPGPLAPAPLLAEMNWKKVAICLVALVLYAVSLQLAGLFVSTFLFMFALTRLYPETSWKGSLAIAALAALGFWLVFVRLMAVNFPPPAFGF